MYYYVFDPPSGPKEYERTSQIKEYLNQLGIAGEMVQVQPGRSVEQLVATALIKRYSTIIAVGGSELINKMAGALATHDVVFGIIPLVEHEDIRTLIGTTDWKAAADQLKRRRWGVCQMGIFANGAVFLTPAHLDLGATHRFQLSTSTFAIQGSGGSMTVTPAQDGDDATLLVELQDRTPEKKRWWQQFGKSGTDSPYTKLPLREFSLETFPILSISVAGIEIAKTPTSLRIEQKTLKLIASKQE